MKEAANRPLKIFVADERFERPMAVGMPAGPGTRSARECGSCQQENLVLGFRDREKFKPSLKPNPSHDPTLRDEKVTCATCHVRDEKIVGPFESAAAPHPVTVDPEMKSGIDPGKRCHVVTNSRWDVFCGICPCGTVIEISVRGRNPDSVGCHMPSGLRCA
jgi:hypothetical protein